MSIRDDVEWIDDANAVSVEGDDSDLDSDDGGSHSSSGLDSSSESDDPASGASASGGELDESEDDLNDEHFHFQEATAETDSCTDWCDMNGLHPGPVEDTDMRKRSGYRWIVLILSALLALLLLNAGRAIHQIFQLSRLDSPPPKNDAAESLDGNTGTDPTAKTPRRRGKEVAGGNKRRNLEDNDDYAMPKHPSRIHTHVALSGKNYRAGGVLSDEMLHRYEEDGVLVIRNLVSPKLLDRLDEASRMLIDGDGAGTKKKRGKQFHMVKNGAIFLGVPPPKDETTCNAENADETCEGDAENDDSDDNIILSSFRDLAMYSKLPRVAASLLRLDELRAGGEQNLNLSRQQKLELTEEGDDSVNLRICRDIFLTKDDDPYACGWHTDDTGFWPSVASDPGVNAWVALDDMPWPWSGRGSKGVPPNADPSADGSSRRAQSGPVATFTLSLGSHRAPWRHEAYRVTGSTHTDPPDGYQSAADLVQRRSGSGTCNIQTSAPHLYEKLEENKVIYDLKRGDVIFHDRWVFHRTVTANEYNKMAHRNSIREREVDEGESHSESTSDRVFRRYSIRYAPGTAVVPPGYGVELSVIHDDDNANRTLDEIVEKSGPWYPKAWPHVLKKKPLRSSRKAIDGAQEEEEEIEGLGELVHYKMPRAEELQKKRKKEIQRLVSMRGGQ